MSDQPGTAEAFPDKLHIFRRDRKMTFGDHVNHDPNDWQAYIRADAVQAQIDAAVKAERAKVDELLVAAESALDDLDEWLGCSDSLTKAGFNMDDTTTRAEKLRAALADIRKGDQT
jgi:hypothetical protein